jgi:type IV pilus assembly protein PilN
VLRGSIAAWVLMGLVVFYVHSFYFSGLIKDQRQRNGYLQGEISKLNRQIKDIKEIKKKKRALIARMEVIQQLQRDRTEIVHVLDDLVRKLPEGMYLTWVKKAGKKITLKGVAQSNARISTLMRNLDSSNWFANPNLDVINVAQHGGERVSHFTLRVNQTEKPKNKGNNKAGVAKK